ncbi:STAS-like domain-containing protein [uncultured Brachyspira sp.]|uniref:STAS-like domain-containing protein n=1 Tax=uncultured Brachyspira sp. TaxID=221953 RepID=UPI00262C4CDC|nr:STAS-like domain-containing protein [uncultured Brachyspira sp.]
MKIKLSEDYTKTPGGRLSSTGKYSAETFRDKMLIPKLEEAISKKEKLIIDFDGLYGCGISFLEETFGGLIRKGFTIKDILNNIEFISNEDNTIIPNIMKSIKG